MTRMFRQILLWTGLWAAGVSLSYWLASSIIGFPESQAAFYALAGGLAVLPAIAIRVRRDLRSAESHDRERPPDGSGPHGARRFLAIALVYVGAGVSLGGVYLAAHGAFSLGSVVVLLGLVAAVGAASRARR